MTPNHPVKKSLLILALWLSLPPLAPAQELQEQVEVQLVQVDVVATDKKGILVNDLKAEDFVLKENGKEQAISHFYNSANDEMRYPLAMTFLVDTSGSMKETVTGKTRIDIAVDAADQIMNQLNETDQIELIDFNDKPEILAESSSDLESVWSKFDNLKPQEKSTSMYDSVLFALDRLKDRSGRKILVIFSDGMDTSSKDVEEDVIDALHTSDTTVIAFYSEFASFGFGGPTGRTGNVQVAAGEDILRNFADISGGAFFSFHREAELVKALEDFRAYVKSQYTLAYKPPAGKAGWRKIKLECKRKDVKLKYREGYTAG